MAKKRKFQFFFLQIMTKKNKMQTDSSKLYFMASQIELLGKLL